MVECGLGNLAACLPTIYGLFRQWSSAAILRSTRSFLSSPAKRRLQDAKTGQHSNNSIRADGAVDVASVQNDGGSAAGKSSQLLNQRSGECLIVTETYAMEEFPGREVV